MDPPIDDSAKPSEQHFIQSQPSEFMYFNHPIQQPEPSLPPPPKKDIFGELDRTTYIIIFVVFILGFFMGKSMQPVILRAGH